MNWLDAQQIISSFGDWVVVAVTFIIFFETAFIFTSFLPGDSLLFLTGLALATADPWLPHWLGFLMVWIAAFLGTQTGYWIGWKIGPKLFSANRNFLLNDKVLEKTHDFFEQYGSKAIVLARFVPILRALVPMLAGISKMDTRRFTRLNALGATLWVGIFMFGGYAVGNVNWVKQHVEETVLIIVVVTTLLIPLEILRDRKRSKQAKP